MILRACRDGGGVVTEGAAWVKEMQRLKAMSSDSFFHCVAARNEIDIQSPVGRFVGCLSFEISLRGIHAEISLESIKFG